MKLEVSPTPPVAFWEVVTFGVDAVLLGIGWPGLDSYSIARELGKRHAAPLLG